MGILSISFIVGLVFIAFVLSVDAGRIPIKFCDCEFNFEWNPLCGTNGRTYRGPNFLNCQNNCENDSKIFSDKLLYSH